MDYNWLIRKSSQESGTISRFRNPFPCRPWMKDTGAAAAASGNTGFKGIVAGMLFCFV